jgi:AcrR family transcriptional regulator
MPEPVKPRRYDSPRRRAQAEATRREILEAAERRFVADGYAATTMAAIAKEAGVALKTVYVAFETKSGVLRALWNLRLRGDEADVPIQDRAWYRDVLADPDRERALRHGAHESRLVKERAGGLFAVLRSAADADPDIAALWERINAEFHANQRVVIEALGPLRPGLGIDRAADIMWTLNHPDVWQLLVGRRGWTPDEWEEWFVTTLAAQLFGGASEQTA